MLAESFQPRAYQAKIAEAAAQTNTLVVLPTGLGKTMIAIMVAAEVLGRRQGSKVMVLAPTRPLVMQHFQSFKRQLKLPEEAFAVLTGTVEPGERELLWRKARVVFATPQTVYNDVKRGRVSLKEVSLAVFDEAHRSVRDYTYTKLAGAYREYADHPLILGLTASPGSSKARVDEIKKSLFIERIEARTEQSEDVREYVERTNIEAVKVKVPDEYYEVTLGLREVFNEKVKRLVAGGFLRDSRVSKKALLEARATISARLATARSKGGPSGYIFGAIFSQAQAVVVLHALEMIETQGAPSLARYLRKLEEKEDKGKATASLVKDPRWLRIVEQAEALKGLEHPKVGVLMKVVKAQVESKSDSRVIVFTQYRDTIEDIVRAFAREGLVAQRFVGQSDREGSEGMDQQTQTEVLERFREGRFKILVSSSIGEEGLHVPDVDLVVFYEAVPSEIRYIQRRGRTGRTTEGKVVILLAEGTVDEAYYYTTLRKESRMKELVGRNDAKPQKRRARNPTLLDFA